MSRLLRAAPAVPASVLAGIAMLLAGSSVAVARPLAGYPVLSAQAVRYALAAVLLVPLAVRGAPRRRPGLGDGIRLVALGATGLAAFNVCVVLAVREADPAAVGVVVGGVPLVLALAGPVLEARRPAGRVVAAAAVVTAGAALVQGLHGSTTPRGLALSLGALASEVAFSVVAAPVVSRLGPARVSMYACVAAAALLGAGALAVGGAGAAPPPTAAEAASVAYLAVATPVAFVCWYASIDRAGVAHTGVFASLVPVGTFVTALAVSASPFRLQAALGTLIVGAGLVVALRRPAGGR